MITRKEVLADAEYLEGKEFYIPVAKAIRRLREYVQQDPDPDAELWAEINGLLAKLNKHDPKIFFDLVRIADGTFWRIVRREMGESIWTAVGTKGNGELPSIRDQLRILAIEHGFLTPTPHDMAACVKALPDTGGYDLSEEQVVQVKVYFAALVAKEGE